MMGQEPEIGSQYDCFLVIEETNSYYRFSIQKAGLKVNTENSIRAWYKMYTEPNYPNTYFTDLSLQQGGNSGEGISVSLEGVDYYDFSKNEVALNGLPVN